MTIFAKIDGVVGDATANSYSGWVELMHTHFDVRRSVDTPLGKANNRSKGSLQFNELTVSKRMDGSSHQLFQYVCSAEVISQIDIHVCSTDSELSANAKYLLKNVIISHFDQQCSSSGVPTEYIHMNFTQLEMTYAGRDAVNKAMAPKISGYNLEAASML